LYLHPGGGYLPNNLERLKPFQEEGFVAGDGRCE
jgi:hypothetical protein